MVRVLVRACHPAPCLAVTAFAVVLAVLVGNDAATTAVLAAAVLTGQLSIGWSNDRIDAERDRRTGRRDKPLAVPDAPRRVVEAAIAASVVATVALSLALGPWAGLTHLGAVAMGWAYNLGLKSTWASWAPYALAFGALPAVATLALHAHPAPAWWLALTGALLGIAAHLTNVVPDLADDQATDIVGFPHRIGARASLALATSLLAVAALLIVLGPGRDVTGRDVLAICLIAVPTAAALTIALRHTTSRYIFLGIMVLVAVDVLLLAVLTPQKELIAAALWPLRP